MELLAVKDVKYTYRMKSQIVNALNGVSQNFHMGKVYTITGSSGSGKSTFISLLAGLDNPSSGQILVDNNDISNIDKDHYRLYHVSMIYQNFNLFSHLTALENASYQLYAQGVGKKKSQKIAEEKLIQVGLNYNQFQRYPSLLSGGEQQRVAIARALAAGTEIVLADEPTGNLDSSNSQKIIELLVDLAHSYNRCVIIVTHDPMIANSADELMLMKDGIILS